MSQAPPQPRRPSVEAATSRRQERSDWDRRKGNNAPSFRPFAEALSVQGVPHPYTAPAADEPAEAGWLAAGRS
ncbi:hypothetical protein ColLi_04239 [Colletotrichum liriopes]|uniref:Uncharacterized protein n=1 Tax=Colletotrichum liriopes TaxID=708192 RepID=A0AA37LRB1_9PEZI|nr:hypothetical protein ColLi_04239 [Colletotrichum liriopes]